MSAIDRERPLPPCPRSLHPTRPIPCVTLVRPWCLNPLRPLGYVVTGVNTLALTTARTILEERDTNGAPALARAAHAMSKSASVAPSRASEAADPSNAPRGSRSCGHREEIPVAHAQGVVLQAAPVSRSPTEGSMPRTPERGVAREERPLVTSLSSRYLLGTPT